MRFISGALFGIVMTISFAYVHDLYYPTPPAPAPGEAVVQKPFVNWDSVGAATRGAATAIREQWDKITTK